MGLQKCCAVIHHGGAGTTARVLQAGVPSVIVPILVAQTSHGGQAAEELDCGVHVRGVNPGQKEIQDALTRSYQLLQAVTIARVTKNAVWLFHGSRKACVKDGVMNFVSAVNKLAESMPDSTVPNKED